MNPSLPDTWFESNQRYLTLSLTRIRALLERRLAGEPTPDDASQDELHSLAESMPAPPALETLCALFGLSPFERDVLLLCAGMELDSQFASLLAPQIAPTFGLALSTLPNPHWSALTAAAPLRHWRLVEMSANAGLTQSHLRIDEPILHYLTGTNCADERLVGYVESPVVTQVLAPSQHQVAEQIAAAWSGRSIESPLPLIQLYSTDAHTRRQIAAAASDLAGLGLGIMRASAIPANPVEVEALIRLWERQAAIGGVILLLEFDESEPPQAMRWIETVRFPLIVSARERIHLDARPALVYEIHRPMAAEQDDLWRAALGPLATQLNGHLDQLTSHFDLDAAGIFAAAASVTQNGPVDSHRLGQTLWQACRTRSRPRLGELAQHIQPMASWDDLVLPATQLQTLRELAMHVRQRSKVYQGWGFASRSARGLGISALFAGLSGTGKTMAAEVLANELQLDLYRIDLSQVVNKYIGETEKNLRRVFDAAEEGGAILLFDEADALFGKRSEVKDSHDRYANVEVSYLLQRMEAYRGLAILTTNLKDAIDQAFLRRLRFVVQFPFPDAAQRAEIWRRIFPSQTPTEGLDPQRLARLNVAGGNIRNIALHAAFLAADAREPVRMSHLLHAAQTECAKLEKPLSEAEIGGWR